MITRNLPNILTMTRILLLPFFAAALIYSKYYYALILFLGAGITDILDGYVARTKKQTSSFGTILDPIADKFLLITSFILMTIYEIIPKWITIIVISRDTIVITGSLILYFVTHNLKVEPSILGKASNVLQYLLIAIALFSINIKGESDVPALYLLVVAVITALSGLQYVYKGLKIADREVT